MAAQQDQDAADIASAYVAKLTPEQFASFVAATREPGESTEEPLYPPGWNPNPRSAR